MLQDGKLVAFVMTTDFARARAFYEGVLGFRIVGEDGYSLIVDANGTTLRVTKLKEWNPPPHTIVGWEVPDVAKSVAALRERGVTCERYEFLEQDALGVWTAPGERARIAWFKDPDGNILSFSQH